MPGKYRILELILCLFVILVGLLYKTAAFLSLSVVLPVMALLFVLIPILRYLDGKKRGLNGMALYIPVLCMGLVAAVVILAWAVYLIS